MPAPLHAMGLVIDGEIAQGQLVRLRHNRAIGPQADADARKQLADSERLGDEVVSTPRSSASIFSAS